MILKNKNRIMNVGVRKADVLKNIGAMSLGELEMNLHNINWRLWAHSSKRRDESNPVYRQRLIDTIKLCILKKKEG